MQTGGRAGANFGSDIGDPDTSARSSAGRLVSKVHSAIVSAEAMGDASSRAARQGNSRFEVIIIWGVVVCLSLFSC